MLKKNEFNASLMSYIRYCFRFTFTAKTGITNLLLSRVVNIDFEHLCLIRYEELIKVIMELMHVQTLEQDI